MQKQKKVAAIHDLSGFGRCSLTVIIPVLSALGIQVCPVPTAVLATHTGGFGEAVMKDMTGFITAALNKYKELEIDFDAVYSGFLASSEQIDCCLDFFKSYPKALKVADPVMGDHGRIYSTYTKELCDRMGELADVADVITPNVTEAAILLGEDYPQFLERDKARSWLKRLRERAPAVVMTGVLLSEGCIVNVCAEKSSMKLVECDYVPQNYPGTGDLFASVLTGGLLKGDDLNTAMNKATAFVQTAVTVTFTHKTEPRNGVNFEKCLSLLAEEHVFLERGEL
ncbi:MAG: pyridoxamine kinase [Oscillospiraceae bacterium]|jgi:pyridoxine kinase|nr:pyridoxamine kinase [Oscillospiraceae bacterium]